MSVSPFAGIRELANALRRGEVSSTELTKDYLGRMKSLGKNHRAVAEITEKLALNQAKEADQRFAERRPRGLLDGIPFAVKDLLATKGIPTRWGSPGHASQVFHYDSTAVARLQAAGGVLIAKLAMIEIAGGGNYMIPGASATGACLSAFDMKRWAGGSSSGSGPAAMLGLCGYTLGSETSGSITCPCAFNGASGIRPTYGRVSRFGAMPLCWTLDKIGPIARSIDDCGIVLSTIAGYDPKDGTTLRANLNLNYDGPKPRIGLLKEDFRGNDAVACEKSYREALAVFRKLGYETVEVAYPKMPYMLAVGIIVDAEGASAHEHFIRSPRLHTLPDTNQAAGLAASLETRAVDYLWAMRLRTEALKANAVWDKCDCIFTPTFLHAAVSATGSFDKTWKKMGGDEGPSNLLGWPAAAFPIGFENGAPLGGQVIAPAMREDVAVKVALDFQRETDWHLRKPKHAE
ncbi:MAG TPA: amidase [Fimbriimonadaceae bacterium]|nr:amidase [Fimbriimonadaceae bacterium]